MIMYLIGVFIVFYQWTKEVTVFDEGYCICSSILMYTLPGFTDLDDLSRLPGSALGVAGILCLVGG